jgi:integrase
MSRKKTMVERAEEYLVHRRSLGFQLKVEGGQLLRFAEYADEIRHRGPLTIDLAVRWARLPKDAKHYYWARRLEVVRPFARYMTALDPRTQIPPERMLGPAHRRIQPYIYSPQEIRKLLQAARQLEPRSGLRPRSYAVMIGLQASAGLRTCEAFKLTREDVDLKRGLLAIRETKFHKSRLVPLHPSTTRALRRYIRFRDSYCPIPRSNAFFLTERGTRLGTRTVYWTFQKLCDQIGLRAADGVRRPRLYDLRHGFACRTLLRWHREGKDVDHWVAALSTYLGHVKVSDTYWYLTGIPELFAVTAAKFERYAHSRIGDLS